jgi:hypothetical protein
MPSSHLSSITPELLSSLFVCSEKEAAKILGICLTTLKKACRRHGIDRWPYRKIKSGQLRESNSLRRSSSNSVRNPRQSSVSPPSRSSDYDSESSSQNSSNTVKLAHSHSTFKEQTASVHSIFDSNANPPPMYSFDDADANHGDGPMWMSAIEESSQKKDSQQIEHQDHYQQYQYQQQHHQQQYQQHQQQHYLIEQQSQQPQHQQLLHRIGHIVPSHGHLEQGVSDMEYSDCPVVYSRPIDATLYNF